MLQIAYVLGFLGRDIIYTFLQILHPEVIVAIIKFVDLGCVTSCDSVCTVQFKRNVAFTRESL